MKRPYLAVLIFGLGLAAGAPAQPSSADSSPGASSTSPPKSSAYDGAWHGVFTSRNNRQVQVNLIVAGSAGSWTYVRSGMYSDPCAGPELPIVVKSSTPTELRLVIDGESAVKGCGKSRVTLKPGADNQTLEGRIGGQNGVEVKFGR